MEELPTGEFGVTEHALYVRKKTKFPEKHLSWLVSKNNAQGKPWLIKIKDKSEPDFDVFVWNPELETKSGDPNTFQNDCFAFTEKFKLADLSYNGSLPIVEMKGIKTKEVQKEIEKGKKPVDEWNVGEKVFFGLDDNANFAISKVLKKKNQNDDIQNPEVGEIVIGIRDQKEFFNKDGNCPYHAAFVIARSGKFYITLEANAANASYVRPVFDYYLDTPSNKKSTRTGRRTKGKLTHPTFLKRWKGFYQVQGIGK